MLLNEARKIVVEMQKKFSKVVDGKISKEKMVLSMHESATKLWVASECKKGREEVEKRIGSALYGALLAAEIFNVKDLEKCFLNRVEDLRKELSYQKNKKQK